MKIVVFTATVAVAAAIFAAGFRAATLREPPGPVTRYSWAEMPDVEDLVEGLDLGLECATKRPRGKVLFCQGSTPADAFTIGFRDSSDEAARGASSWCGEGGPSPGLAMAYRPGQNWNAIFIRDMRGADIVVEALGSAVYECS
ncbi:MAG TPA: hypothetical protein VLA82_07275 [Actinomycetota bacterium]|nr:hypothetical protein [Actinomycetota bacterium]